MGAVAKLQVLSQMDVPTFDHDGSAHATANEGTIRYLEFTLERNSGTSATMERPQESGMRCEWFLLKEQFLVLGRGFVEKPIDFRDAEIRRGKLKSLIAWNMKCFCAESLQRC